MNQILRASTSEEEGEPIANDQGSSKAPLQTFWVYLGRFSRKKKKNYVQICCLEVHLHAGASSHLVVLITYHYYYALHHALQHLILTVTK